MENWNQRRGHGLIVRVGPVSYTHLIYTFLQVPGGDAQAFRLVWVSIFVAMLALILSEVMARAVARRIAGR